MTSQPGAMREHRIVVGVDGSVPSKSALAWAVGQAKLTGAPVEAVIAEFPTAYGYPVPVSDVNWRNWPSRSSWTPCGDIRKSVGQVEIGHKVVDGSPADLRIPGYRVEDALGRGGMAVVYQAVDVRLRRTVALRVLAPALAADDAFRQRFARESRAAAAVDHPHILPIYETGEVGGTLYIAMRYVPGGDVHQLIGRTGRLTAARAASIISAAASALDAAHAAGLVHRDVKPANMLLDATPGHPEHVYLSDFGLSKSWPGSMAPTGSGMFLGTPNYSAPEQIDGKPVDGRSDQYALACTAFEMLAGQPPFKRDDATAVIWAHMSAPPPLLTELRPGLPAEGNQVFARALAKVHADRYPTCADFGDALRAALGLAPYHSDAATIPASDGAEADHAATEVAVLASRDGPSARYSYQPPGRRGATQTIDARPSCPGPHGLHVGRAEELQIRADALGRAQHRVIVGYLVQGPVHRLVPEPRHGPRVRAVDHHRGHRSGVPVDRSRLQHAELVALRIGQDSPWHVALAHVGGRCAEFLQARDHVRLMGCGGRGELDAHEVLHRLGLRVGNDVDADGSSIGIDEAHGLEVGHAGFLAVNTPAQHLRPEPAERRVIPSLHMNLNKSRRH